MYMYSYVGNLNNMATLVGLLHDQISKHASYFIILNVHSNNGRHLVTFLCLLSIFPFHFHNECSRISSMTSLVPQREPTSDQLSASRFINLDKLAGLWISTYHTATNKKSVSHKINTLILTSRGTLTGFTRILFLMGCNHFMKPLSVQSQW